MSWQDVRRFFSEEPQITEDKGAPGWYCFARFRDRYRDGEHLLERCALTLDYDRITPADADQILKDLQPYAHVAYTTWSHDAAKPRLRAILPLSRTCTPVEFEAVSRVVSTWIAGGIELTARESHKPTQFMFLPAVRPGEQWDFHRQTGDGPAIDVDQALGALWDWQERDCWPRYAAADSVLHKDKAADPRTKPGVIGAFCRAFTIPDAIERFGLPYEEAAAPGRWTYTEGSRPEGAVCYDDDTKLHSHHDTDPAAGQHNAFDLVRLHRFHDLDADAGDATSVAELPSHRAMVSLALDQPEVRQELASVEFDDLGDPPPSDAVPPNPNRMAADDARPVVRQGFHELYPLIQENAPKGKAQCDKALELIAAARLIPTEVDILCGVLREYWYAKPLPSKASLIASVKQASKTLQGLFQDEDGKTPDLQRELIEQMLREHYADGAHLKRTGRQFWGYDRGVWRPVSDEVVRGKLQLTLVKLRTERKRDHARLVAAVGESKTSALLSELWNMMCSALAERDDADDPLRLCEPGQPVINCRNGELVYDRNGTFRLMPHDPERFLTSQVPVDYDPAADCPEWDRFCGLIFPAEHRKELQRHLEELGGYLIQQSRWLKTWVLFHGASNAGKTTIGAVFNALLKKAAVQRAMSAYSGSNSHAEAGLVGKLMLIDEDFDKSTVLPDGWLKKISEEKALTANPKSKDEFNFNCRALPVIIANHWPATRDVSDAMRNRALVFNFEVAIPEHERSDARAEAMLTEELPGILARFAAGFARLRARGGWDQPAPCLAARERWSESSNTAALYAKETVEKSVGDRVKAADLWRSYRAWSKDAGLGNYSLGKVEFFSKMDNMLGPRGFTNGTQYYRDCKFKADEDFT